MLLDWSRLEVDKEALDARIVAASAEPKSTSIEALTRIYNEFRPQLEDAYARGGATALTVAAISVGAFVIENNFARQSEQEMENNKEET